MQHNKRLTTCQTVKNHFCQGSFPLKDPCSGFLLMNRNGSHSSCWSAWSLTPITVSHALLSNPLDGALSAWDSTQGDHNEDKVSRQRRLCEEFTNSRGGGCQSSTVPTEVTKLAHYLMQNITCVHGFSWQLALFWTVFSFPLHLFPLTIHPSLAQILYWLKSF